MAVTVNVLLNKFFNVPQERLYSPDVGSVITALAVAALAHSQLQNTCQASFEGSPSSLCTEKFSNLAILATLCAITDRFLAQLVTRACAPLEK